MVSKLLYAKSVWKTVIGLEIHVQINSKTKLFSIAPNNFHSPPNTNVAYFDMAIPGTLPILNSKCVELAILAASALKCEIDFSSEFDRKHYFYSDMPAGYQITQYNKPIGRNGKLEFLWNSSKTSQLCKDVKKSEVRISQIHLEQDSGKSLHDYSRNVSMIDLNRAGVGLLEVVTDCHFQYPLEAVGFIKELRTLFMELGICNGLMEEGELRVDVNISVNEANSAELGERSEVKNINSLRGVLKAIEFESKRHIELLESGQPVENETRFYDPVTESTLSMRDKENIQDYRYCPEPNLPPLRLQRHCAEQRHNRCLNPHICVPCIQHRLNGYLYPYDKRQLLVSKFSMSLFQTNTMLSEPGLYNWMICVSELVPVSLQTDAQASWFKKLGHLTLSVYLSALRMRKMTSDSCGVIPHKHFADLVTMVTNAKISSAKAVEVLDTMFDHLDRSPEDIVKECQLELINDPQLIEDIVRDFARDNPKALKDYKNGNKRVSRFFKRGIKLQNRLLNSKVLEYTIDKVLEENNQ